MTNTQKKALEHVLETLLSFNGSEVRLELINIMTKCDIDPNLQRKIADKHHEAISAEERKIIRASDWIKTIIKDYE